MKAGNKRPVTMISSGLWRRIFAGRSDCIGETLKLSDRVYTVVGVLPPSRGALRATFRCQ
jgi:hypothetical protein